MKYRKLRIAWSIGWGIACVLLIVLWMRSYWKWDAVKYFSVGHVQGVDSEDGVLALFRGTYQPSQVWRMRTPPGPTFWESQSQSRPIFTPEEDTSIRNANRLLPQLTGRFPSDCGVTIPYWFMTVIFAAIGICPWLRFSLRTLLIATTLVAMVLGLIVYAARK